MSRTSVSTPPLSPHEVFSFGVPVGPSLCPCATGVAHEYTRKGRTSESLVVVGHGSDALALTLLGVVLQARPRMVSLRPPQTPGLGGGRDEPATGQVVPVAVGLANKLTIRDGRGSLPGVQREVVPTFSRDFPRTGLDIDSEGLPLGCV